MLELSSLPSTAQYSQLTAHMARRLKFTSIVLGIVLILQDPEVRDAMLSSRAISRAMVVVGVMLLLLASGWIAYDYLNDDGSHRNGNG